MLALGACLALVWLGSGLATLAATLRSHESLLGPSAGGVLIAAGLAHGILLHGARSRAVEVGQRIRRLGSDLAAWVLVGLSLSLALTLGLVDRPDRPWIFLASAAVLSTAVGIVAVARPAVRGPAPWSRALHCAAMTLAALAAAAWTVEAGLRIHDLGAERSLESAYALRSLEPRGPALDAKSVSFDRDSAAPDRNVPRESLRLVTIIGDEALASDGDPLGLIDQLEERFPEIEWTHRGLPGAGPREYAALVDRLDEAPKPNLLLVCVSAADDQLQPPPQRDFFAARSWKLWQAIALGFDQVPPSVDAAPLSHDDRMAYELDALRACRIEPDPSVELPWRKARRSMAQLVERCRERQIDVAIVVVPAAFQADPLRWQRVVRCSGAPAEAYDVRLPQHRWTTLAVDLGMPLIDLLPTQGGLADRQQVAASRLSDWLDRRFGRSPAAPESSVVSRQ